MKVNARGDELGPGGMIVKTRNEAMDEYYASNAIYTQESAAQHEQQTEAAAPDSFADLDPEIAEQDAAMPEQPKLRGSLADAVAKSPKVVEPKILTNKKPISRI
jgi:phage terminase large subunit GpA-like protein